MEKTTLCDYIQFGIPKIDQKNKQFSEEMNQLIERLRTEKNIPKVLELLSTFADYASQHFRHEEAYLLNELDYFEYSDHRDRHLFFEHFLRDPILINCGDNECDTEELSGFLMEWVNFHIQQLDKNVFFNASKCGIEALPNSI